MKQLQKANIPALIAVTLFLFVYQQLSSIIGARLASNFDYSSFDPYNVFAWISMHHIIQMLLGLFAIALIAALLKLDFRFRIGDYKKGIKYIAVFTAVILAYHIISYIIGYAFHIVSPYEYPLKASNIVGTLGFQLFLSGTEEILFRALPVTIFAFLLGSSKYLKLWKLNLPVEIIMAAFLFSIAHINWQLNPFALQYDVIQLIFAFVVGIIQGIAYQKCNSILYPLIMHSLSNTISGCIGYFIVLCM